MTEDGDALKEELKTTLLKEYDGELKAKMQEEAKITSKARTALKNYERELSKPSPTQYYTSMFVILRVSIMFNTAVYR